jgi:hypothetical protein
MWFPAHGRQWVLIACLANSLEQQLQLWLYRVGTDVKSTSRYDGHRTMSTAHGKLESYSSPSLRNSNNQWERKERERKAKQYDVDWKKKPIHEVVFREAAALLVSVTDWRTPRVCVDVWGTLQVCVAVWRTLQVCANGWGTLQCV